MILYIAGPMTGLPNYNYPAFEVARSNLTSAGFEVLCPTDVSDEIPGSKPWSWYMRQALSMMLRADGVALLPGWENSRGASIEHSIALMLDMPVRSLDTWLERDMH